MNTALMMLEFQNDYFANGRIPLDKSLEACNKAEAVLRACREKKLPIIHVQHISTDPEATYMLPCTKGADFYPTVQPMKQEMVIKKHYPNSFKDTGLLNHLIKNQINHLVICGMMTQSSIDATVRAAHDLGFSCTVLYDACAARQLEFGNTAIPAQNVHYAFLAALQPAYASVLSSEDFLQKSGARIAAVA
jgi:nicotinamidase-related amidase